MNTGTRRISSCLLPVFLMAGLLGCSHNPNAGERRYFESGERYMKQGKYQEARTQFRSALKLDPQFIDAYYELAQCDLALDEWPDALVALTQLTRLDPNRLDARLALGQLYLAAREYDKADDEAKAVLDKDPNNVAAYKLLGGSQIGKQQPDQALDAFRRIADLTPKDASAWVNLALVEVTLGHYTDSQQHLRKAAEVDPKFVSSYANFALLSPLEKHPQSAENILQAGTERALTPANKSGNWSFASDMLPAIAPVHAFVCAPPCSTKSTAVANGYLSTLEVLTEPGSMILFGTGLFGVAVVIWRRKKAFRQQKRLSQPTGDVYSTFAGELHDQKKPPTTGQQLTA